MQTIPERVLRKPLTLLPRKRRPSKKLLFIVGSAVVLVAGAVGAFMYFQPQNKTDANSESVYTVRKRDVDVKVTATGVIRPIKEVKVSPKQMGLVKQLFVKQGDFVVKGQPIAQMDDINIQGQVDAARAAYLVAKDQYDKARSGSRPQEVAAAAFQAARIEKSVSAADQNVERLKLQLHSLEAQAKRDAVLAQRQTMLAQNGAISDQDRLNAVTQSEMSATQLKVAQQELRQARTAVQQAQAEASAAQQQHQLILAGSRVEDISAASHSMMQAEANLRQLQTQVADMVVRAPFNGLITQKYADEGAFVTPTTSAATDSATSSSIVALAGALEMVAQVSEADIAKVRIGQPVEIAANALSGQVFHGRVTQMAPAAIINQNVTTFEVHAALDQPGQLLSGMTVSSRFILGKEKDAMMVPTVAIAARRGQTGVYVYEGNNKEPVWKKVTVGASMDNRTVIKDGLKEGDRIALGLSRDQLSKSGYSTQGGGMRGMGGFMGGGMSGGMRGFGGGGGGRGAR